MVRLSLRNPMVGFARSCNHVSLVESRKVRRGGGLKVLGAVKRLHDCRFSRTATNRFESVDMPDLFLRFDQSEGRAVFVSFMICDLLLMPPLTRLSDMPSSGWLPIHGNKSAVSMAWLASFPRGSAYELLTSSWEDQGWCWCIIPLELHGGVGFDARSSWSNAWLLKCTSRHRRAWARRHRQA